MNRYRALTPAAVGVYGEGVVELDLSADAEANAIGSGLLALVPRSYRAVSHRLEVARQNEIFEATYVVDVEAALIEGGHIERVDTPPKPPKLNKE